MIKYPSTPFVYEARVLAIEQRAHYIAVKLALPGVGKTTKFLRSSAGDKWMAYDIAKTSKECFRDISYGVFGDDFRWFEASMTKREGNRMKYAIARKLSDALGEYRAYNAEHDRD